jgi:hypothetical protein
MSKLNNTLADQSGRSNNGVLASNTTRGLDVCFSSEYDLSYVGSDLVIGSSTFKESYNLPKRVIIFILIPKWEEDRRRRRRRRRKRRRRRRRRRRKFEVRKISHILDDISELNFPHWSDDRLYRLPLLKQDSNYRTL